MNDVFDDHLCPLTELVIAHFLDGACDDTSLTEQDELRAHREECVLCRSALERARRLDALLASVPPTTSEPERVDRWIDRAVALRSAPKVGAGPRRASLLVAAAVLLLACGVALGTWLAGGFALRNGQDKDHDLAVVPVQRDTPLHQPTPVSVPSDPSTPSWVVDAHAIRGLPPAVELSDSAARRRRAPFVSLEPASIAWLIASPTLAVARIVTRAAGLPHRAGSHDFAEGLAVDLAGRFLRVARPDQVIDLLVSLPDDFRLDALIGASAQQTDFLTALRTQVRAGDRVAASAAARVGGPELDAALAACISGDDSRVLQIADALRSRRERPGRAALMMQIASELLTRGATGLTERTLVERMFAGGSTSDAAWLAARVETVRNACDRRRALLALGVIAEPSTSPTLLRMLRSPRVEDTELAAWALGRMPVGSVDVHPDMDARRRSLELAARASRREPDLGSLLRGLSITPEERAFLLAGSFNPEQIGIAARLFRERGVAGD